MKKKSILIIIFIIALIVTFIIPSCVKADFSDLGLGNAEQYKGGQADLGSMESKVENILGIIRTVGVVTSVVMLMAIGIKYMLGSTEEKAEYKQTLKPYIIGAFILFTGTIIPEIIYKFAQNI